MIGPCRRIVIVIRQTDGAINRALILFHWNNRLQSVVFLAIVNCIDDDKARDIFTHRCNVKKVKKTILLREMCEWISEFKWILSGFIQTRMFTTERR